MNIPELKNFLDTEKKSYLDYIITHGINKLNLILLII